MPGVCLIEDIGVGAATLPPWESAPSGVVSLLAMLEFAADKFVELSYLLGVYVGRTENPNAPFDNIAFNEGISKIGADANKLGLVVTRDQVGRLVFDAVSSDPSKAIFTNESVKAPLASMSTERLRHHVETIYSTMKSELGAIIFRAIPRERVKYENGTWLRDSVTEAQFPTSFVELERAGRCFALGQPTASVFHSMRALEPALSALARPFNVPSSHENWQNIIEQIESAVRAIGQKPKSPERLEDDKFFGNATSHLFFVKNAWRNHVAHTRDSYSDDEAEKVMRNSLEFVESLCSRLRE